MPTQISRTRGDFHFFMIVLLFEVAEAVRQPARPTGADAIGNLESLQSHGSPNRLGKCHPLVRKLRVRRSAEAIAAQYQAHYPPAGTGRTSAHSGRIGSIGSRSASSEKTRMLGAWF